MIKRIRQIADFAARANAPAGAMNMAVLGFARGHTFGGPDLIARMGRTLYPKLVVRPRLYNGFKLALDPTDISHLVVAEEILVENVYDMTLLPFEPTVIVDCGAHIGMFTLLAAARFPKAKITCFEPNGSNAQWLKRQIANNRIAAEVIEAAVSTREGEASFSASCSCGGAIIHDKGLAGAVTVKMIRLADFLSTKQDSRLLLKLDLEGEEAAVLPDIVGRLPETCGIFLETHHGDESWSSAKRLLESHGFDVRTIRRRDIYTDGVAIRCPRS